MDELKPCPYCGSDNIKKDITVNHGKIRCGKCGVSFSRCFYGMYGSLAEAKVEIDRVLTKVWNRRAEDGK